MDSANVGCEQRAHPGGPVPRQRLGKQRSSGFPGSHPVDLATVKGSKAILQGTRAKRVREVTLEGARKGFAAVIEKAVRRGAIEEDLSLALLAASSSGHDDIVVQLLAAKAMELRGAPCPETNGAPRDSNTRV